jgi:hypothetical protein
MDPPRKELRRLLKAAIAKGELSPELDAEVSLALLLGPIIYWFVFLRQQTVDPRVLADADPRVLAEKVVEAFWRAFGMKTRKQSPVSKRFLVQNGI